MSKTMENVKTVNSAVRTVMMLAVAGGLGYVTWFGYSNYIAPGIEAKQAMAELKTLKEEFQSLETQLETTTAEKDRLATSLKLLKLDKRAAFVEVMEIGIDDKEQSYLEVRFTEIDPDGNPIGASRDFTLQGETFFIDTWMAKFQDRYIEEADGLRGASLFKFKRIFGDDEKPSEAQSLEHTSSEVPEFYKQKAVSDFEKQIWSDFHAVCNDPKRQDELGIRAVGGQAPHIKAEEGRTYKVTIRATGDISLNPIPLRTDGDMGGDEDDR